MAAIRPNDARVQAGVLFSERRQHQASADIIDAGSMSDE